MDNKWKAIATCGIWLGVGIACAFQEEAVMLGGAAVIATFFIWVFGD